MKKLILIPSLAIASSLPALCAVSCGNAEASSKWSLEEGEFVWTHGLASGSVYSNEEATDKYFKEIDKKILADDMIKYETDIVLSEQEAWHLFIKYEREIKINDINKKDHRISFKTYMNVVANEPENDQTGKILLIYKNFPVKLFFRVLYSQKAWQLSHVDADQEIVYSKIPPSYREDTKWSCSIDVKTSSKTIKETINYKTSEEESLHADAISYCFDQPFVPFSWLFQNILLIE